MCKGTDVQGDRRARGQMCKGTDVQEGQMCKGQMCKGTDVQGDRCARGQMCKGTDVQGDRCARGTDVSRSTSAGAVPAANGSATGGMAPALADLLHLRIDDPALRRRVRLG